MTFQEAFQQSMSELFAGVAFLAAVGVGIGLLTLWDHRNDWRKP